MGYFFKNTGLVKTQNPPEQEIALWEARIEEKETELAGLAEQVQNAKITLNLFAGEYNSLVGMHYVNLDKIGLQIREYRQRIKKLKEGATDLKKLKEIEEGIEQLFAAEREKIKQKEKETSRSSNEYKQHLRNRERSEINDPELLKRIKVIFRKLALKYHPDKAKDPEEEREFQAIMAAINDAYAKGDLSVLVLYMEQVERDEKIERETPEEKVARLKNDYEKVCAAVEKLKRELAALLASDIMRLKRMAEDAAFEGRNLLSELTKKALAENKKQKEILNALITEYQELVSVLK